MVCGDVESNPGHDAGRGARVLYANIRGLHANLTELGIVGSKFDVMVCAETKVSDRRHLSELRVPGFGCPQQRLRNSTPGAQGMALYVREGFRAFRQSKFECACHESFVVRICSKVNNFYIYGFYRNPGHDGSLYDCMLGSMGQVQ